MDGNAGTETALQTARTIKASPGNSNAFKERREKYLKLMGFKPGPCERLLGSIIGASAVVVRPSANDSGMITKAEFRYSWRWNGPAVGSFMEDIDHLIHAVNAEVSDSKKILEGLKNEVGALSDVIQPQLYQLAQELRASRMTVVAEIRESLSAMKEVRKFFLESDYATEVDRLERFVRLCREFQALKAAGVLDAVIESAIRLAVKEV